MITLPPASRMLLNVDDVYVKVPLAATGGDAEAPPAATAASSATEMTISRRTRPVVDISASFRGTSQLSLRFSLFPPQLELADGDRFHDALVLDGCADAYLAHGRRGLGSEYVKDDLVFRHENRTHVFDLPPLRA